MKIKYLVDEGGYAPTKAHEVDAGFDIRTPIAFAIKPHGSYVINTKLHMHIPPGYVGFIKSKSGLNVKHDLVAEGVIDADYTGEIVVKLYNNGNNVHTFFKGDKLTQIVILPIPQVELEEVDNMIKSVTKECIIEASDLYLFYIRLLCTINTDDDLLNFIFQRVSDRALDIVTNFNKAK